MRFNEQGRSMIEMLGVLAIVGVLSVGGIAGYSKAMAKFNTNKAVDQVNMISTNIRTMFSSQRDYSDVDVDTAIKANLIPAELYSPSSGTYASNAISNAFGGTIYVDGAKHVNADDTFVIAMDNVPQQACVALATTEWGSEAGGGLVSMRFVDGSITDAKTLGDAFVTNATPNTENDRVVGNTDYGFPVSVADATKNCYTKNTFAWQYQ